MSNLRLSNDDLVLLCEGISDQSFFASLTRARGIPGFQIFRIETLSGGVGGVTAWTEAINGLIADPNFENIRGLLIVADNDERPVESFNIVRDAVAASTDILSSGISRRLAVPTAPLQKAGAAPAVVTMMIPWVGIICNLETLCFQAIRSAFPDKSACVDALAQCTNSQTWPVSPKSKMQVRSYLASSHQSKPEFGLTRVWNEAPHLIPLNNAIFDQVADFLSGFGNFITAP